MRVDRQLLLFGRFVLNLLVDKHNINNTNADLATNHTSTSTTSTST